MENTLKHLNDEGWKNNVPKIPKCLSQPIIVECSRCKKRIMVWESRAFKKMMEDRERDHKCDHCHALTTPMPPVTLIDANGMPYPDQQKAWEEKLNNVDNAILEDTQKTERNFFEDTPESNHEDFSEEP